MARRRLVVRPRALALIPVPEVDDPRTITRPDPALRRYYLITSLFTLFLFPLVYIPLYLKYRTLRYRFDEEGVSMSYGLLFQQETYLNYRRIQDIQMRRNLLQRRLGLADLELQTASGASGAEMKIEGIRSPERLRDFLYERMRGGSDEGPGPGGDGAEAAGTRRQGPGPGAAVGVEDPEDEALRLLHEIRDELRALNTRAAGEADSATGEERR